MNTFRGWRDAGHAMRWARAQPGITHDIVTSHGIVEHRWSDEDRTHFGVVHIPGERGFEAYADGEGIALNWAGHQAAGVLDLLAGLGYLPARFSSTYEAGVDHTVGLAVQLQDAKDDITAAVVTAGYQVGGLSTSARLAQAEYERDELRDARDCLFESYQALAAQRAGLAAELASARQELEQRRARPGWIVARDGGRTCLHCDQEIRRGEAYEYDPAADTLTHIHCPDTTPAAGEVAA